MSRHSPIQSVRETCLSWSFPRDVAPWTLCGTSRSALATSFFIPEMGWTLDAGAVVFTRHPEQIFLTHTHSDHSSMLTHHRSRRKPPEITLPGHAVELLDAYLDAAQVLTSSQPKPEGFEWTEAYRLRGVQPGDRLTFERGQATYVVDVIRCDHSVPCVGYIFSRVQHKLKPALRGVMGSVLAQMRKRGEVVTECVETPLFAFLGDTTPKVYEWHPELLRCKVIIGECTFLDPEHREGAWERHHTHWEDLSPIIEANPDTTFVVTHFSLRYRAADIREFFAERALPNMVTWIGPSDVH